MVFETQAKTSNLAQRSVESKSDHSEKPKGERDDVRLLGRGVPEALGRVEAVGWEFVA